MAYAVAGFRNNKYKKFQRRGRAAEGAEEPPVGLTGVFTGVQHMTRSYHHLHPPSTPLSNLLHSHTFNGPVKLVC